MMALDMTLELAPMLYGMLALLLASGAAIVASVSSGTTRKHRTEKRTPALRGLPVPAAA